MSYKKTDYKLAKTLEENGFRPYPSHSNKYWNHEGQIIWTDGDWYQRSEAPTWSKYSESDKKNERI